MPKVEPILKILFWMMAFLLIMLIVVDKFLPNDGQVFQVIAGLLTATSGAFFMGIKTQLGIPDDSTISGNLHVESPKKEDKDKNV